MKLNGLVGGGTGKLGNSVFSQNAGRTIVRQYQSEVKNPNTARQQNSRARFTMAGVIAKLFAQALAIGRPRVGALTSRNQFTKDIIPVSAGVINMVGTTLTPDYSKMPIAKGGMPKLGVETVDVNGGAGIVDVQLNAGMNPTAEGYIPPMPGSCGFVVVVLNKTADTLAVRQFTQTEQGHLECGDLVLTEGDKIEVYCFSKWVPTSYNDITTATEPWKYPSDQADATYCGEFTVGA